MNIKDRAKAIEPTLIAIRRHFHMYPEVSYQEFETSKKIVEILQKLGIKVIDAGLETGVIGLLETGRPGPTIALRGDIDALPVQEMNDTEYKSKIPGVSHACGHEVHTTAVLGAAMILAELKEQLCGNIKFLFQPLEERNQGALRLIEAGALENPRVDAIFGLHNQPDIPAGFMGIKKKSALMAAVDRIKINVNGVTAHGSLPHRAIDTIVIAAHIVTALQTIVSRTVSPQEPAVVSICQFHAGNAYNVIPDKVELVGTVRTFSPEVRNTMPSLLDRIAQGIAASMGGSAAIEYYEECPLVISTDEFADIALKAAQSICGPNGTVDPVPSTGGEDFAWYLEKVPGCFMWLGVGNKEQGIVYPWHSPRFDVDESAIAIGAAVLAQCVIDSLNYVKQE